MHAPVNTPAALLARLQSSGLTLAVTAEGALQVSPASALDEATRAAIALHKSSLIDLLTGADVLADERHRCRDCYHLQTAGNCAMALQGRLPGLSRWHTPPKDVPARCHLFCAVPE